MIRTETVFVLGAGASAVLGFPTGAELRRRICADLTPVHSLFQLLKEIGQEDRLIAQFRDEFGRSGINSIDTFIAFRPQFQVLGELAIAAVLVPLESELGLMTVDGKIGHSDWYQMLWNEMLTGVAEPQELLNNRIRFITFNYDRSLEQYLLNGIRYTFGLDQSSAFEILKGIPIRHVYGSLGDYDSERGFRYGDHEGRARIDMIANARQSIKTVPSIRGPGDTVAAEWLAQAERVFVMGFGFDAINCTRIGLANACSEAHRPHNPPEIFASAYNLTNGERDWCVANARAPGSGGLQWTNGDCLALLRDRRNRLK